MEEIILQSIGSKLFVGGSVFFLFALGLFLLWVAFGRIMESIFSRTKFKAFGAIFGEVHAQAIVLILLISAYFGVAFADEAIIYHPAFKIWSVLVIISIVNIIAPAIVCAVSEYCKRSGRGMVYERMFSLIREGTNLILYSIAVILIVEVLNPSLGIVVAIFGGLLLIFAFALFYSQIKNVVSGMQAADRYVRGGDYVRIGSIEGFVEAVRGRTTLLRSQDGSKSIIPNTALVSGIIENFSLAGSGNVRNLHVACNGGGLDRAKKMIFQSAEVLLKAEGVMKDYSPNVIFSGMENGMFHFIIRYKAAPFSDFEKIEEGFRICLLKNAKKAGLEIIRC